MKPAAFMAAWIAVISISFVLGVQYGQAVEYRKTAEWARCAPQDGELVRAIKIDGGYYCERHARIEGG